MTNKSGWLYEISFMRPILLVLLVSYHAFAPYSGAWAYNDKLIRFNLTSR